LNADRGVLTVDLTRFDAFALDLDGVVTRTATVHAAAWKRMFDELLAARAAGNAYAAFDPVRDYRTYVDGKARADGLRSFLAARDITIPEGRVDDPPSAETVHGLAARKDRYVHDVIAEQGVEVYVDALAFIHRARDHGVRLALVTASENCSLVLAAGHLDGLFSAIVDGLDLRRFGLHGKPAPDEFLVAARRLTTAPKRIAVFEDATAGVEAGSAGGFGLVIGIDRDGAGDALLQHGANAVVHSFDEIELRDRHPHTVSA
jgi:beta-phosphoglucomutase family hydrolase